MSDPKSTRAASDRLIPQPHGGRIAPPWTRETRPDPWRDRRIEPAAPDALRRMAEKLAGLLPPLAESACACGCRFQVNPTSAVVVPSVGYAVNEQHAGRAMLLLTEKARLELRR